MRLVAVLVALALAGCSGSRWKGCEYLEIHPTDSQDMIALRDARYRIVKPDPLTVEYTAKSVIDRAKLGGVVIAREVRCDESGRPPVGL